MTFTYSVADGILTRTVETATLLTLTDIVVLPKERLIINSSNKLDCSNIENHGVIENNGNVSITNNLINNGMIQNNANGNINTVNYISSRNSRIDNEGTLNISGKGKHYGVLGGSGEIETQSDFENYGYIQIKTCNASDSLFNNYGVFHVRIGSTSTLSNSNLTNYGVLINDGTIDLDTNSTITTNRSNEGYFSVFINNNTIRNSDLKDVITVNNDTLFIGDGPNSNNSDTRLLTPDQMLITHFSQEGPNNKTYVMNKDIRSLLENKNDLSVFYIKEDETVVLKGAMINASIIVNMGTLVIEDILFNLKIVNVGVLYIKHDWINLNEEYIYNLGIIWKSSRTTVTELTRMSDLYINGKSNSIKELQTYTNTGLKTLIIDADELVSISGIFRNQDVLVNYGTLTIEENATLENQSGGIIRNYGTITIESGGEIINNGTIYDATDSIVLKTVGGNILYDLSVNNISELLLLPINLNVNQKVTLTTNSTYTTQSLVIKGEVDVSGNITIDCSSIEFTERSVLKLKADARLNISCNSFVIDTFSTFEFGSSSILNIKSKEVHLKGRFVGKGTSVDKGTFDISQCDEVTYHPSFINDYVRLTQTTKKTQHSDSLHDFLEVSDERILINPSNTKLSIYSLKDYFGVYTEPESSVKYDLSGSINANQFIYLDKPSKVDDLTVNGCIFIDSSGCELDAITNNGVIIVAEGGEVTLNNNTLTNNSVVICKKGGKITIESGYILQNDKLLINEGVIENKGTIENTHRILGNGVIINDSGTVNSIVLKSYLTPITESIIGVMHTLRSFISELSFDTMTNSYVLKDSKVLTVHANETMYFSSHDILTIEENSALIIKGKIIIADEGQLVNKGFIVNDGNIDVKTGGSFICAKDSHVILNSDLSNNGDVHNDGTIYIFTGGRITQSTSQTTQHINGSVIVQPLMNTHASRMVFYDVQYTNSQYIMYRLRQFVDDTLFDEYHKITGNITVGVNQNNVNIIGSVLVSTQLILDDMYIKSFSSCENDVSGGTFIDHYHKFDSESEIIDIYETATLSGDKQNISVYNFGYITETSNLTGPNKLYNYGTINGTASITLSTRYDYGTTGMLLDLFEYENSDDTGKRYKTKMVYVDSTITGLDASENSIIYVGADGDLSGVVELSESILLNMSGKEDYVLKKDISSVSIGVDTASQTQIDFSNIAYTKLTSGKHVDYLLPKKDTLFIDNGETVIFYGKPRINGDIHNHGTITFGDAYDISKNTQFYHLNKLIDPGLDNVDADADMSYNYASVQGTVYNYGEVSIYNETFLYGDIYNLYGGTTEVMNKVHTIGGMGRIRDCSLNYPLQTTNIKDMYKPLVSKVGVTQLYLSEFLKKYRSFSTNDYVLTSDITIPKGYELLIQDNEKVTINDGITLTVNGSIHIEGTFISQLTANVLMYGTAILAKTANVSRQTLNTIRRMMDDVTEVYGRIHQYVDMYKDVIVREDVSNLDVIVLTDMNKRGKVYYKNTHNIKNNFQVVYANGEYTFYALECNMPTSIYVEGDSVYTNGIYVHFGNNELQLIFNGIQSEYINLSSPLNDMITVGVNNNVIDIKSNDDEICVLKEEGGKGVVKINTYSFDKNIVDIKQVKTSNKIGVLYSNNDVHIIDGSSSPTTTTTIENVHKIFGGKTDIVLLKTDGTYIKSSGSTEIMNVDQVIEDDNGIMIMKNDKSIEYI